MPKISELLNIQRRFLRSAQLERDFRDPNALQGYVVTPQARASFERISEGLGNKSGQRAGALQEISVLENQALHCFSRICFQEKIPTFRPRLESPSI